jgi:hypothetical protein
MKAQQEDNMRSARGVSDPERHFPNPLPLEDNRHEQF